MKKRILGNVIKIVVIAGILLSSFSVFYYYVIFLPSLEKSKFEFKKKMDIQKIENQQQLEKTKLIQKKKDIEEKQYAEDLLKKNKQDCYVRAMELAQKSYKSKVRNLGGNPEENYYLQDDFEGAYKNCLRAYGY